MGEMRNAYIIFGGKPYKRGTLKTCRHKWEDTIKMDLELWVWKIWIGFIWFRIDICGGLL
jgi:hypothetical protein